MYPYKYAQTLSTKCHSHVFESRKIPDVRQYSFNTFFFDKPSDNFTYSEQAVIFYPRSQFLHSCFINYIMYSD